MNSCVLKTNIFIQKSEDKLRVDEENNLNKTKK